MHYKFEKNELYAIHLDKIDPLGKWREHFFINEEEIYMCGNSLGLKSKEASETLDEILEIWKKECVGLWNIKNNKYFNYSNNLAAKMAPLVGAMPEEVAIVGSTTSNIHQAISTLYKPTHSKYKILIDNLNFPTDKYAIDSQVQLKGLDPKDAVKLVKSRDGQFIYEDDIIDAMTDDVALVFLPLVLYSNSQILDINKVTKEAKKRNILIGWDLCHAIGAIPINFESISPDFAVWCTYKYLNGGPGSIAGLYINQRHFDKTPGLSGWFGNKNETQFQLKNQFEHEKNASGWQIGTPSLLSMAPLEGALSIFEKVGIEEIRKKSLKMTDYMMYLTDETLSKYGFTIGNPRESENRGGHVCLIHEEAYRISQVLKDSKVTVDFRKPNIIRMAPVALYNSYIDVYKVIQILLDSVKNEKYKNYSNHRGLVT
ncbi:kynureninase [Staphylococcus felis]|uniref:kynureninase n=1 Tax=Staphylococcus felis TaxID=46127 RepID=UPI0024812799|nr:kynureninase [Staphylococcus felis]MDQ7192849.1 kynureninase [Staphylococcus felis]